MLELLKLYFKSAIYLDLKLMFYYTPNLKLLQIISQKIFFEKSDNNKS